MKSGRGERPLPPLAGAQLSSKLGLSADMAALGVVEMVDENMANAARVHAIESGKTYAGRTLIAFGGSVRAVTASRVAEKIGIDKVLVPSGAGVGSAIGFLRAPVGYEVVRSLYQRFSTFDVAAVNGLLADMQAEADAVVTQGSFGAPTRQTRIAFMRYVGQGHEIPVPLPPRTLVAADVAAIRASYDTEYSRFYDRPVPGSRTTRSLSYCRCGRHHSRRRNRQPGECRRQRRRPGAQPESAGHQHRGGNGLGDLRPRRPRPRRHPGRPGHHRRGRNLHPRRPRLDGADQRARLHRNATRRSGMSKESSALAGIQRQVMWNRLISVVEEQARDHDPHRLLHHRAAQAGDLSAGIFDLQGRMLAQAVTGTPGHVNSMMESVGHFLNKFPAATMRPGDHYITNDPWLGTGHLHDLTVVTPAFRGGRIVGLFANTAHIIDIGGLGMGPEGRSVFEEGLYIPIVKCFEQGQPNETFFDFIRAGSRLPVELEGDIYSLCACNDAGARRLVEMMDEVAMDSLDPLANFIFDSSLRATIAEI